MPDGLTAENQPHRLTDEEVAELVIGFVKQATGVIQLLGGNASQRFQIFSGSSLEANNYREHNRDFDDRCAEVLHELFLQGVIMHASSPTSPEVFQTTSRGREMLDQEHGVLTDPSRYLQTVTAIPGIDQLTIEYLEEAVQAHRMFLDRSAAVMLGAAAENELIRLADSLRATGTKLGRSPHGDLNDWRVAKIRNGVVETVSDRTFVQSLESALAGGTPMTDAEKKTVKEVASTVGTLSRFYADTRNEAGHPTAICPDRLILNAYIRAFPGYATRIADALQVLDRLP